MLGQHREDIRLFTKHFWECLSPFHIQIIGYSSAELDQSSKWYPVSYCPGKLPSLRVPHNSDSVVLCTSKPGLVFYLNTERVNFLISSSTPWLCVWCLNLPVQGCFYVCDSHSTIELFQSIIFKPWELMHTHSHTHILRGTNFTRENICAYVISVDMQMPIKIIYLRNRNI